MKKIVCAASTALFLLPNSVFSEPVDNQKGVTKIETLMVIGDGQTQTQSQLSGSVDEISRDELEYEHPDDTYELFDKAPGVYISRYNQGIINTDIAIRGFAGDGVTPHAKLLIDGIPFNLNNGYGELDQLFPSDIERIELFKGNADVRYGLFNLAGNYHVETRRDIANEFKLTLGSFDTLETQIYNGFASGPLTHSYFLGYRQAEGYRDHTDIDKLELSGKWFYDFGNKGELGLSLRHSTYEADSPGYFDNPEQARQTPTASPAHASEDGGDKTVNHIGLHYTTTFGENVDWETHLYANDIERNRWVRFFERSTLQNRVDDQKHTGLRSVLDWYIDDQWSLNIGADVEKQDIIEQRFVHAEQTRNSAAEVNRDREYTLRTSGAFVRIEQALSDAVRWNVGVRFDDITGERLDTPADIYAFGTIIQPKANLIITPNDTWTLFANAGRSFQHPYGSAIYTAGDRKAVDVSMHNAYELGTKWQGTESLQLRLSYWGHKAKNEFLDLDSFQQIIGDPTLRGIDLGAITALGYDTKLWLNLSLIDSEITRPNVNDRPENAATVGKSLRSIPKFTASVGVNHQINDRFSARVHIDGQGDYYVNENNIGAKTGGYTLVSAGLDYDAGVGTLSLQLNNLLDEYYEYAYDFTSDGSLVILSPGDGVNASLTYSHRF